MKKIISLICFIAIQSSALYSAEDIRKACLVSPSAVVEKGRDEVVMFSLRTGKMETVVPQLKLEEMFSKGTFGKEDENVEKNWDMRMGPYCVMAFTGRLWKELEMEEVLALPEKGIPEIVVPDKPIFPVPSAVYLARLADGSYALVSIDRISQQYHRISISYILFTDPAREKDKIAAFVSHVKYLNLFPEVMDESAGDEIAVFNLSERKSVKIPKEEYNDDYKVLMPLLARKGDVLLREADFMKLLKENKCDYFKDGTLKENYDSKAIYVFLHKNYWIVSALDLKSLCTKPADSYLKKEAGCPFSLESYGELVITKLADGRIGLISYERLGNKGLVFRVMTFEDGKLSEEQYRRLSEFSAQVKADWQFEQEYTKKEAERQKKVDEKRKKDEEAKQQKLDDMVKKYENVKKFPSTDEEKKIVYNLMIHSDYAGMDKLFKSTKIDLNYTYNDFSPLSFAVLHNNIRLAEFILKYDSDPNYGRLGTPLHTAVAKNNYEMIELLIKHGADVNRESSRGRTPLDVAVNNSDTEEGKKIIALLQKLQKPTLSTAVKTNNLDALKELLKDKENLKEINEFGKSDNYGGGADGKTLLYYAAELGYGDICRELIKAGANPALKGDRDCDLAPIVCAGRGGHADALKAFLEVKDKIPQYQLASALSEAATSGRNPGAKPAETVKLMLDAGVNPEWSIYEDKDKKGSTPFQTALQYGTKDVVDLFLAKGLKMPFWAACKWGDTARMKEHIAQGEDVNKEYSNNIPINFAVDANQIEAVKLLLENKCRINFNATPELQTPLYIAAEKGHVDIVELLLKAGANPNCGEIDDMVNNNPLYVSLKNQHYKVAEALLKGGARTDAYCMASEIPGKEYKVTMFDEFKEGNDQEALKLLKKYKK